MGKQMIDNPSYQLAIGFSITLVGLIWAIWGAVYIRFCRYFINLNLRFMKYWGYGEDLQRLAGDVVLARFFGAVGLIMGLVISGIGINHMIQYGSKKSRPKVVPANPVEKKETGGLKDGNRRLLFVSSRRPAGSAVLQR
jgi:hypothetical protein